MTEMVLMLLVGAFTALAIGALLGVTDPDTGRIELNVWDGRAWRRIPARITSSRLAADFPAGGGDGVPVARADRIGRTYAHNVWSASGQVPVRAADLTAVARDTAPRLRLYTDRRPWRRT